MSVADIDLFAFLLKLFGRLVLKYDTWHSITSAWNVS